MKKSIKRIVMLSLMMMAFSVCAFAQETVNENETNVSEALNECVAVSNTEVMQMETEAEVVSENNPLSLKVITIIVQDGRRNVCIRTKPSTKSKVIGHANGGDEFDYAGENKEWYQIWYKGRKAWITKLYTYNSFLGY